MQENGWLHKVSPILVAQFLGITDLWLGMVCETTDNCEFLKEIWNQ